MVPHRMTWTLIISTVFLVAAVVKALPEPCILHNNYCRFSGRPCCGKEGFPMFGMLVGEEYTCSVFDSGRCEPMSSFKNIEKHFELVGKLNETNFDELRIEYFKDLQRVEREQTAGKPIVLPKYEPECIGHYGTCRGSFKHCCGQEALPRSNGFMGREYTCHVFGSGRCKELKLIRNLVMHNELVSKLNNTNFEELKRQYLANRRTVQNERTGGKPTAVLEVGLEAEPQLEPRCIPYHAPCRFSIRPCCGKEGFPMFGTMMGEEYTCSVFDSGRCEPMSFFKNIDKHFELVGKLNDTNFEELRRQYFRDLQRVERERTTAKPSAKSVIGLQAESTCINHYDPCRGASKPCCGQEARPASGILMGQEYICSVFGSGLCEPATTFMNIKKHLELVQKLNDTNFEELRREYRMDVHKVLTERIKGKLNVELVPEPELHAGCISYHNRCRFSGRPCCGKEGFPMFGTMMGEEYTCSVFDSGRCEPIRSFKNIEKHFELVGKLNEINFDELRIEYFKDLQRVEREQTAAKPTADPTCINHYDRCRGASKPCCGQEAQPASGILMGQEYICSVFGSGLCEPAASFKNLNMHLELVQKLNDTNFDELRSEYVTDLQRVESERTARKPTAELEILRNEIIIDNKEPERYVYKTSG